MLPGLANSKYCTQASMRPGERFTTVPFLSFFLSFLFSFVLSGLAVFSTLTINHLRSTRGEKSIFYLELHFSLSKSVYIYIYFFIREEDARVYFFLHLHKLYICTYTYIYIYISSPRYKRVCSARYC